MRWVLSASILALFATSCAASLPRPSYVPQPPSALVAVTDPPPPARVEAIPPAPNDPRAVWIDGEWTWRRARWAWSPGRWVVPPEGASFSPWIFVRSKGGTLAYAPGVWRDVHGAIVGAPAPIALATVGSGGVVDASGDSATVGPSLRGRPRPPRAR